MEEYDEVTARRQAEADGEWMDQQIAKAVAAERERYSEVAAILRTLAAQHSGIEGSITRADCMADLAELALRKIADPLY